MNIGLDFDGVIADTGYIKKLAARRLFNKKLPISDIKREIAIEKNILSAEEYHSMQIEIYKNFSWLEETPPVEYSIDSIKKLIGDNYSLKIITSRFPEAETYIKKWLLKYSINIPLVCMGYGISKAKEAQTLDLFVDDSDRKLLELIGVVPKLYLFTQPYNANVITDDSIQRVNDWRDLLNKIEAQ